MGKKTALDKEPKIHPAGSKLWGWWQQLQLTRDAGFGPAPLTHQEIRAWRFNMRIRPAPQPWEIDIILQLDQAWLTRQHKKDNEDSPNLN